MNSSTTQRLVRCLGVLLIMAFFSESIAGQTTSETNQSATTKQTVTQQPATRVLVISGTPCWEYRLLNRHLSCNDELSVKTRLQSLGEDRQLDGEEYAELPGSKEAMNAYDVIILLDPNPAEISSDWLGLLKSYCSEGGGLIFVAGPTYTREFLNSDELSGIRELLPINFRDGEASVGAGRISVNSDEQAHPVIALTDDVEKNRSLWASMPALYRCFSVSGKKSEARILLEASDGIPLVVAGDSENGKVLFIGHNQSWRWRRIGDNAEHYRVFWNRAMQFTIRNRN